MNAQAPVVDQTDSSVRFTHLHLHTPKGSLLDGFCRIDPMIKLAQEFGMDSIGVSDHGTCFAHIEFYQKCKEAGIHPVLGMEGYITSKKEWKKADFDTIHYTSTAYRTKEELAVLEAEGYVALEKKLKDTFTKAKPTKVEHHQFLDTLEAQDPEHFAALKKSTRWYMSGKQDDRQKRLFEWAPRIAHLLMIAKTDEGYKNLLKLTSIGALEGFYGKPRIDYNDIKKYGKGLIATSSCLGGTIPQLIKKGRFRAAKNHIKFYQRCFDEFYLEIQPSTMEDQIYVNNVLMTWAKELNVPLVATADAHMLRPEERSFHKAMTSISKTKDSDESDIDFYEHCVFYSKEEMLQFNMPPEALENAYKIAHSCHVNLDVNEIKYPEFEVPPGHDFDSYLAELSNAGMIAKMADGNFVGDNAYEMISTYKERLDFELKVIADKGLSAYLLIVWDYINYARQNNILVGPGRGSAAGSLISYVLGITNLDPIRYNLLFERFLNPERPGMPDIDTDFDFLRRHEVLEYVTKKYGEDRVAQIMTFGKLSTKSALKDIGRVLGIDHNEINTMNKHIPITNGEVMSISDALEEVPEVIAYEKRYPKLFELAKEVEDMPRTQSVHACGVLITPDPITDEVPLLRGKGGEAVAANDGPTLEAKGFIKFDFLGLKNLSVIEIARRLVEKKHGYLIDVDNLIPEDEKTFEMFRRGETDGVFQVESDGMKKMFRGMNRVNFDDVIAGVALYRPGPMEKIPGYIARKNGQEEVPAVHPLYDGITKVTYGFLVYQEQVMEISKQMAGYSMGEADVLRKAVGKKKLEILNPALEQLHQRMLQNGIPDKVATKVCEDIRPFAGYGFNLSHAACYSFISYQTAYLKANYPTEYMAALLQVFYDVEDKVVKYTRVSKEMGITILAPDLNKSSIGFTIEGDKAIRFGLGSIKGLGKSTIEAIMEERERGGNILSIVDLIERIPKKNLNKKALSALCFSGALDVFGLEYHRSRFDYLAYIMGIRGEQPDPELAESIEKYTERMTFVKEKETLGIYLSGHILDRIAEPTDWEELDDSTHHTTVVLSEAKTIITKKGDQMAFLTVDTLEGEQRLTLFPQQYQAISHALVPGMMLKVGIRMNMNWMRDQKDFIITTITAPKKINADAWKKININATGEGAA